MTPKNFSDLEKTTNKSQTPGISRSRELPLTLNLSFGPFLKSPASLPVPLANSYLSFRAQRECYFLWKASLLTPFPLDTEVTQACPTLCSVPCFSQLSHLSN